MISVMGQCPMARIHSILINHKIPNLLQQNLDDFFAMQLQWFPFIAGQHSGHLPLGATIKSQ